MATELLADAPALRRGRRELALGAMAAHGIDVLLLGREANTRYVSGANRLWTAGTRPFGPGCVVVRATGAVHLVSTWDEGVPDDIPHENLFGITWNPGKLLAWLQGIEGVASARRFGTDSLTPRFAQLLPRLWPDAEFVDAEPLLEATRRRKTPEEVTAIRASIEVAESALAAAVEALRPGATERHLAAVFMAAMADLGVTTPATQRVAWASGAGRPSDEARGRPLVPEDLVVFEAGVVAGGYLGEVGRTWPVAPEAAGPAAGALSARLERLQQGLIDACRPGAPASDLLAVYAAHGLDAPPVPVATGLGLGFDRPVVHRDLPDTAAHEELVPGMVLAVTAWVRDDRERDALCRDAVLITDAGPEVLTHSPRWSGEDPGAPHRTTARAKDGANDD